jgi:hypothetical protein
MCPGLLKHWGPPSVYPSAWFPCTICHCRCHHRLGHGRLEDRLRRRCRPRCSALRHHACACQPGGQPGAGAGGARRDPRDAGAGGCLSVRRSRHLCVCPSVVRSSSVSSIRHVSLPVSIDPTGIRFVCVRVRACLAPICPAVRLSFAAATCRRPCPCHARHRRHRKPRGPQLRRLVFCTR